MRLKRHSDSTKETQRSKKKVETLTGDGADPKRRKQLVSPAMNKYNQNWISKGKIKINISLTIYTTLVKPILTYCLMWILTKSDDLKIDAFPRNQLRRILDIKYQTKI